jgi:hypothetical protein
MLGIREAGIGMIRGISIFGFFGVVVGYLQSLVSRAWVSNGRFHGQTSKIWPVVHWMLISSCADGLIEI